MLHAITLNPALDVSGIVENLVPNEKSYVFGELHTPGGNGINAGIIAKRLGTPVTLSGFLGGPNGEEIKSLLDQEKVTHKFVSIKDRTRMNVTISNQADHLQTRLSFPGPKIEPTEKKQFGYYLDYISSNDLVLFGGSLPESITTKQISGWMKQLNARGIRVMVDMPGKPLQDLMKSRPYFIKPNLTEFQALTGKKVKTIAAVVAEAQKLLTYVPNICISSVEGGAVFLNEHECWYGKIPAVKIFSTVGAGDSMVGAIAGLWIKHPNAAVKDLLQLGLTASCATLTQKGMNLGKKKDILSYRTEILMKQVSI